MLQRFEKTNEMLTNVNSLSATRCGVVDSLTLHPRLERANNDFKKHTAMVVDMKKDLDSIFKRIRGIKAKLARQMPESYARAGVQEEVAEEDDEYDLAIRRRGEEEARGEARGEEEARGEAREEEEARGEEEAREAEARGEEDTSDNGEVEEATEKLKL